MALSKELIERFQAEHLSVYGEVIDFTTAELELKELAELVRIATPKEDNNNEQSTHS